jgi:hypothetical protein
MLTQLEIERTARDITNRLKEIAAAADNPDAALAVILKVVAELKSELRQMRTPEEFENWIFEKLKEGKF